MNRKILQLEHFPKKYGKTHILVSKIYDHIYGSNVEEKNIIVYANDIKTVEYIAGIFTTSLAYDFNTKKEKQGEIIVFNNDNFNLTIGTYNEINNLVKDIHISLVLFDELLFENNCKEMYKIMLQYSEDTEFKAYYTSKIGPFEQEIFDILRHEGFEENSLKKCIESGYEFDIIKDELIKLSFTVYDNYLFDTKINNNVQIQFYSKLLKLSIEKDNLSGIDKVNRILYSDDSTRIRDTFGSLFKNKDIAAKEKILLNELEKYFNGE